MATARSDSAGITIVNISGSVSELPAWSISARPLLEVGNSGRKPIGTIGEVAFLSDGRLLVEDGQAAELYLFDRTGGERVIGRRGEGPGEFRGIDAITVTPGDTIFAYDRSLNRVSAFGPQGSWLASFPIGGSPGASGLPRGVWAFDSDHFIVYNLGPRDTASISGTASRDQRMALLSILDGSGLPRSGASVQFPGSYTILAGRVIIASPFANTPIVAIGRDHVLRGSGIDYGLVLHDRDLDPEAVVRWSGWGRPLTPALLESVRTEVEQVFAGMFEDDPATAEVLVNATFDSDLLPDTLPALGSAIIDDRGRIWVSRFRPATDPWSQADAWHVLDERGEPLARLRLPPQTRLVAIHGDTVAIVVRDDLDVQHLAIHGLERT